ncbi:MAG: iron-sulfur cluster assembly protein [Thermoplasmata archaeon]
MTPPLREEGHPFQSEGTDTVHRGPGRQADPPGRDRNRGGTERLHAEAIGALSTVTDPELDEPITDLGFVRNLSVDDGDVAVDIRTSTFWCSPNFVYMMLEDARDALSRLPDVRAVRIYLDGHHDAAKINNAINAGKTFAECYGPEAENDIAELHRIFQEKALRSRLHGMAVTLVKHGLTPDDLAALRFDDVRVEGNTLGVRSGGRTRTLELEEAGETARVIRYLSFLERLEFEDGPLVIWDLEGNPPPSGELDSLLTQSRSVRFNLGLNAELCRALLKARIGSS